MAGARFRGIEALFVVVVFVGVGFAVSQPGGAAPLPQEVEPPTQYSFVGVANEWIWTVREDTTLGNGHFVDAGLLQIDALCTDDGSCAGDIVFTGSLGAATCSTADGEVSGYMELYLGSSFDCDDMNLQLAGLGACEVKINVRAEMAWRRLGGDAVGLGPCV